MGPPHGKSFTLLQTNCAYRGVVPPRPADESSPDERLVPQSVVNVPHYAEARLPCEWLYGVCRFAFAGGRKPEKQRWNSSSSVGQQDLRWNSGSGGQPESKGTTSGTGNGTTSTSGILPDAPWSASQAAQAVSQVLSRPSVLARAGRELARFENGRVALLVSESEFGAFANNTGCDG